MVAEGVAEAGVGDEIADREGEVLGLRQQPRRQSVESQDVARHAQERGTYDVASLREIAGVGAAVLETAGIEADGERHVRLLGRYAEMLEQRDEVGIVALVVDDEADIDCLAAVA